MITTELMTEQKMKEIYHQLQSKTNFAVQLADRLEEEGIGRSPGTITKHWFSDLPLSGNMPKDKRTLEIIEEELKKAPKK